MTRSLISAFSSTGFAVTIRDFAHGLQDYGVQLEESEIKKLFKYFDKTDSGKIDLADLLDELRG
jgi:Ca2+-binding EF-hand superfamily protein